MYAPIITPKDFEDRVRLGTSDPAHEDMGLEFKGKCHYDEKDLKKRDAEQREAARDITQFANTEGGTVIYGVDEHKDKQSKKVTARGLLPTPDVDRAIEWLVKGFARYIYPLSPIPTVTPITVGETTVIAVNTEPSIPLQGVWNATRRTDGMEFLFRNNNKKEQMNMEQVMIRMNSTPSRAMQLRFLEMERHYKLFDGNSIRIHQRPVEVTLQNFVPGSVDADLSAVRLKGAGDWALKADLVHESPMPFEIPYDWIRSVWWGNNGHGATTLNIHIRGRIWVYKRNVMLDPDLSW